MNRHESNVASGSLSIAAAEVLRRAREDSRYTSAIRATQARVARFARLLRGMDPADGVEHLRAVGGWTRFIRSSFTEICNGMKPIRLSEMFGEIEVADLLAVEDIVHIRLKAQRAGETWTTA